jgi:hypothetical protein
MSDKLEHYYLVKYKSITRLEDIWGTLDERRHETKQTALDDLKRVFFTLQSNRLVYVAKIICVNSSFHEIDISAERERWGREERSEL